MLMSVLLFKIVLELRQHHCMAFLLTGDHFFFKSQGMIGITADGLKGDRNEPVE